MAQEQKALVRDHWHVWKDDGVTVEYVGGYYNENAMDMALEWRRKQKNPEHYTVTNKGPLGIIAEHAEDPEAVMADPEKRRQFEYASKSQSGRQPYQAREQNAAPRRRASVVSSRPKPTPKPKVKVDAALANAAGEDLERLRADEAAELAQED